MKMPGTKTSDPGFVANAPWFILSGAADDQYLALRSDSPAVCTSTGKRVKLYAALSKALEADPVILSPPPRGNGSGGKLEPVITRFAGFEQRFSRSCGIPKLRMLLDLFDYATFVHKQMPKGSLVVVDNYELIYVLPLCFRRLMGSRDVVILEYEDGKHLIDRGIYRAMSGLAEAWGKHLLAGAILAAPGLARRLPSGTPSLCVPGIAEKNEADIHRAPIPSSKIGFLYSGSLDAERGIPLLLEYLRSERVDPRATFDLTGQGYFSEACRDVALKSGGSVRFHGHLSAAEFKGVRQSCRFGLNLQRSDDPISEVTFPSKTFDYLNSGLELISTRAAGVPQVFGDAAHYLKDESVEGLAAAVTRACDGIEAGRDGDANRAVALDFSFAATVEKLKSLLSSIGIKVSARSQVQLSRGADPSTVPTHP